MSNDVSNAMQPVTNAPTVQQALNLLAPTVASMKGAKLIGDGANAVAAPALADGNVEIGDHTQPQGVRQVALPAPAWQPFAQGTLTGTQLNMSWTMPCVVVPNGCASILLPDGNQANSDLAIYLRADNGGPATFAGQGGQQCSRSQIEPGEVVTLKWAPASNAFVAC